MEAMDFFVEDFLDLTNGAGDDVMTDTFFDSLATNSADSSTVTPVDSCNSSVSGADFPSRNSFPDPNFSGDLCLPYDDMAELEWLSNFVEESFSSENLIHKIQLIPVGPQPGPAQSPSSSVVPGKARSKRSRVAPCDWSTRLLMVSPPSSPTTSSTTTTTTEPDPARNLKKPSKKRGATATGGGDGGDGPGNLAGEVRRCLHCAAEKTPQWRTGPLGPKTLCNACGVRYKSGRLVPEYRPAASPTFVSAKHSNSHRKVVELRRQKELQGRHHNLLMGVSHGGAGGGDDYFLTHAHLGPGYRREMM